MPACHPCGANGWPRSGRWCSGCCSSAAGRGQVALSGAACRAMGGPAPGGAAVERVTGGAPDGGGLRRFWGVGAADRVPAAAGGQELGRPERDLLAGVLAWVRSLSAGGAGRGRAGRPGADPRTLLAVARYVILGLLGLVLAAGLWLGARRRARRRRTRRARRARIPPHARAARPVEQAARRPPPPPAARALPAAGGEDARRAIRRLYRGLLARMAAVDPPACPGPDPAGPRALAPQVPGCGAAVATREAYLRARYAPEEPGAEG